MLFEHSPPARFLQRYSRARRLAELALYWRWVARGRKGTPPRRAKILTLKRYAETYGLRTFIETGTYLGDTTAALAAVCDRCISIEVDESLYERARRRFAGHPNVEIVRGDSGRVLPRILDELEGPALFWLDAHYSGGITGRGDEETAVASEVRAIASHAGAGHVVLIDDARSFTGTAGYPTMEELASAIALARQPYAMDVEADIIRLRPLAAGLASRATG